MNSDKVDWEAYIDAMAALHRLPLDAGRRAEVARQMNTIGTLAQLFMDFPLKPEVEIAPAFRP